MSKYLFALSFMWLLYVFSIHSMLIISLSVAFRLIFVVCHPILHRTPHLILWSLFHLKLHWLPKIHESTSSHDENENNNNNNNLTVWLVFCVFVHCSLLPLIKWQQMSKTQFIIFKLEILFSFHVLSIFLS